jgi:dynein heavy chain
MVERFLVRRQGNHYGPQPGTSLLCLIEDLNMPLKDQWKDEPCSEVLRSLLESGFVYSLQKPGDFKTLDDIKFIATANMHQEVDDLVSDRLRSRCLVAAIPEPDLEYMKSIFHPILEGRNRTYSAVGYEIKDMIVRAFSGVIKLVLNLHQDLMVCRRLYHWSFTMHNVANLCQAFISLPPDSPEASNAQLLACFLFHECERELCDQLPEEEHAKFHKLVEDACKSSIKVDMKALRQSKFKFAKAIWTDLTEFPLANVAAERQNPTDALETKSSAASSPLGTAARGRVRPVESVENFLSRANNWLKEHNEKCEDSKAMNLVMFPNMISHLLRLVRILKNERGNAVLVGAPCTGKKSLVRLTAFVVEVFSSFTFV